MNMHTVVYIDLVIALIMSIFGILLFIKIIVNLFKELNKQPFERFNESGVAKDLKISFASNREYFNSSWSSNENILMKKFVLYADKTKGK